MAGFFKRLVGPKKTKRDKKLYEKQKELLEQGDLRQRRSLAEDEKTHPEILFYLSDDADETVRKAVAGNLSTPPHVSPEMARDKSADVRLVLADRLVRLLPDVSADRHSQLYAYTVQALGMLAEDEVMSTRRALASALKEHAYAPPAVVGQLARDVEREVSEPILRFCIALSDDDLLDILSHHPQPWVLSAVAQRQTVSEKVTRKLFKSGDKKAAGLLLKNRGAEIPAKTLMEVIEHARDYPEWHEPIALRPELTLKMARYLAGFVSKQILKVLQDRPDFDDATKKEIAALVRRRMSFRQQNLPDETTEQRLRRFMKKGWLTPEAIMDAIAWLEYDFARGALALMAGTSLRNVEKIFEAGSAKAIVALCWRAGLPMRMAVELQKLLGRITPPDLIYARGGTDYPMSPEDMEWQLELYGVAVAV